MSNSSRIACSLAPANFHHWRSKARIARSRSDSSPVTGEAPGSAPAISIANSRALRCASNLHRCHSGTDRRQIHAGHGKASGVEAAGAVRLSDAADADHLGRRTQRDALLARERGPLVVGPLHDLLQPVVDLVLAPPVRLQV